MIFKATRKVETPSGSLYFTADNAQHLCILELVAQYLADGGNPIDLERMMDVLNKMPYTL